MTHRTDESLATEAARRRRELRIEQQRHATTRDALSHANRLLLYLALADQLADPRDFDAYIGAPAVTTPTGAIDWPRVDTLVSELLRARPHLATPNNAAPFRNGSTALQWLTADT